MKITITINTENAAFEEYPEDQIARILQKLALDLRDSAIGYFDEAKLRDVNGNTVGRVTIDEQ